MFPWRYCLPGGRTCLTDQPRTATTLLPARRDPAHARKGGKRDAAQCTKNLHVARLRKERASERVVDPSSTERSTLGLRGHHGLECAYFRTERVRACAPGTAAVAAATAVCCRYRILLSLSLFLCQTTFSLHISLSLLVERKCESFGEGGEYALLLRL